MKATRRELILLVEDDPNDELMTLRSFSKSQTNVDVVVVRDGAEALDYLFGTGPHAGRDISIMPTRIVLDLYLPKMNGMEVLTRIKADERTKGIPVTIMSGSDYEMIATETLRQGAENCVMKPVDCDWVRRIAQHGPV